MRCRVSGASLKFGSYTLTWGDVNGVIGEAWEALSAICQLAMEPFISLSRSVVTVAALLSGWWGNGGIENSLGGLLGCELTTDVVTCDLHFSTLSTYCRSAIEERPGGGARGGIGRGFVGGCDLRGGRDRP
jgi:hypothetical protein